MKICFLALITMAMCHVATAQLNFDFTAGKFLIKGRVIDIEDNTSLPMANIKIANNGKAITCDNSGAFSMYVGKGDTLLVSSVGHITKQFVVARLDTTQYYTLELGLFREFIKIKEVTIYPYHNVDEFKKAFVDAKTQNKVLIPGIAAPKYSNILPKAKFSNPISFLYDKLKRKSTANPDFKP